MNADDKKVLEAMIEKMNAYTERAVKAIDETLEFVEDSNRRITVMKLEKQV